MRTAALLAALSLGVAPAALGAPASAPADPVDLGGTPVGDASTDPANPTRLEAGLWSDTLGPGESAGAPHQFSYERTGPDTTVHVGVVATTTETSDQVEIESEIGDTTCDSDSRSSAYNFPGAPFGAAISVQGSEQGDRNSVCLTSDVVTFTVGRGTSTAEGDLPVAIKIVEEAPLEDLAEDLPPDPETEPALELPDPGTADSVTGDPSFDAAPLLEDGTHRATGTEGETVLYRVSLDWGETLAVRLDAPAMDAALQEKTGGIFGPGGAADAVRPTAATARHPPRGGRVGEPGRRGTAPPLRRGGTSALPVPLRRLRPISRGTTGSRCRSRRPTETRCPSTTSSPPRPRAAPTAPRRTRPTTSTSRSSSVRTPTRRWRPATPRPRTTTAPPASRQLAALGLGLFGLLCCGLGALQLRRR